MVISIEDYAVQVFAGAVRYHDGYDSSCMLSFGAETPKTHEASPAVLLAYGIPATEHAKYFPPADKHGQTKSVETSIRALVDLLAARGRRDEAEALASYFHAKAAWLNPEYTARRLPCPLEPSGIEVDLGSGAVANCDLGAPRRLTPELWHSAVRAGVSAALLYYALGYARYLGIEVEPPRVADLLGKSASWWRAAALNNIYGLIPADRCKNSERVLLLTGAHYTAEQRAKGLSALCGLAESSRTELAPYVRPLPAESVLRVRSKTLLDVVQELPWDAVRDALDDPRVKAHLLAFLDKRKYALVFEDHPHRPKRPRMPTAEELVALENKWLATADRLLRTGDEACALRDEARRIGGGLHGAFLVWWGHYHPETLSAVKDDGFQRAARELHQRALRSGLLRGAGEKYSPYCEAERADKWFIGDAMPRYFE